MKTKYWVLLLSVLFVMSIGLSIPLLLPGEDARYAEIVSHGQRIQSIDLSIDCEIPVTTTGGGKNIVTVRDGRIGVTEANCPDHHCMDRGMCSNGTQIVCLPNRLIIRFLDTSEIDAIVG